MADKNTKSERSPGRDSFGLLVLAGLVGWLVAVVEQYRETRAA